MKGLIFSIEEFALYDGPGIRVNDLHSQCREPGFNPWSGN